MLVAPLPQQEKNIFTATPNIFQYVSNATCLMVEKLTSRAGVAAYIGIGRW